MTPEQVAAIRASYIRCRVCGAYIKFEGGICWPCMDEYEGALR
jgi:hypothetical protein